MGRFRRLAGSEFQTDGATNLKDRLPKDFSLCVGIFKSLIDDLWKSRGLHLVSDYGHEPIYIYIYWSMSAGVTHRAQELCESRGGRLGLPSLINLRFLWR